MSEGQNEGLAARTVKGTAWAYSSYVGGQIGVLISTAILARLLDPDDFGLVAAALVFIYLLETVSDLGLGPALVIAKQDELREKSETVFAFTVVMGVGLSLAAALVAPLAAAFFHQDGLKTLLPVLGLNFTIRSLGATHYALAQKRMDFRSRTAAEVADVVVRGATGITLALTGFGAWSLVGGYLAGTATWVVTLWLLVPWRPALKPQRAYLGGMLRFGGTLTAVDILAALINQVDYAFVGRVLGATALGLYTLGFRLPELLIVNFAIVAGKVLFPAFATVDRSGLDRAFLVSMRYTLLITLPMAVGLVVLAHPLTIAVFGDKWAGAAPVARVLTVYALGVTIGIPAGIVYKATGRASVLLKLAIPRAALVVTSIAIFVNDGIVAVALCQAAVAALFASIGIALASRLLHVSFHRIWSAVWAPLAAAAGMAAVMVPVAQRVSSPWPALLAGAAAGGTVYLALVLLLAQDTVQHLKETLFPGVRPARGVAADTD